MQTIGNRIKHIRKANKLNQIEFSNIIGVSQGTLSELEQDKYNPSIDTILAIYTYFKIDLEWLLINPPQYNIAENTYKLMIVGKERELITLFRNLLTDDQDEIIGIMELKLKRYKEL